MTSFFLLRATIKSIISDRYLLSSRIFFLFKSVLEYFSVVSSRTANSLCFIFTMMTLYRLPIIKSRFFLIFPHYIRYREGDSIRIE